MNSFSHVGIILIWLHSFPRSTGLPPRAYPSPRLPFEQKNGDNLAQFVNLVHGFHSAQQTENAQLGFVQRYSLFHILFVTI